MTLLVRLKRVVKSCVLLVSDHRWNHFPAFTIATSCLACCSPVFDLFPLLFHQYEIDVLDEHVDAHVKETTRRFAVPRVLDTFKLAHVGARLRAFVQIAAVVLWIYSRHFFNDDADGVPRKVAC